MSDSFMTTNVFFFVLQVSYGVLCVAMTHQLIFKSAALQVYLFFFPFSVNLLDSSLINPESLVSPHWSAIIYTPVH